MCGGGGEDCESCPEDCGPCDCRSDAECDDGDACTTDTCATEIGECSNDAIVCEEGQECVEGECVCEINCPVDLNCDGAVGPVDLAMLLAAWGPCDGDCPADINDDGEVGPADLAMLLASWGTCE